MSFLTIRAVGNNHIFQKYTTVINVIRVNTMSGGIVLTTGKNGKTYEKLFDIVKNVVLYIHLLLASASKFVSILRLVNIDPLVITGLWIVGFT